MVCHDARALISFKSRVYSSIFNTIRKDSIVIAVAHNTISMNNDAQIHPLLATKKRTNDCCVWVGVCLFIIQYCDSNNEKISVFLKSISSCSRTGMWASHGLALLNMSLWGRNKKWSFGVIIQLSTHITINCCGGIRPRNEEQSGLLIVAVHNTPLPHSLRLSFIFTSFWYSAWSASWSNYFKYQNSPSPESSPPQMA